MVCLRHCERQPSLERTAEDYVLCCKNREREKRMPLTSLPWERQSCYLGNKWRGTSERAPHMTQTQCWVYFYLFWNCPPKHSSDFREQSRLVPISVILCTCSIIPPGFDFFPTSTSLITIRNSLIHSFRFQLITGPQVNGIIRRAGSVRTLQ